MPCAPFSSTMPPSTSATWTCAPARRLRRAATACRQPTAGSRRAAARCAGRDQQQGADRRAMHRRLPRAGTDPGQRYRHQQHRSRCRSRAPVSSSPTAMAAAAPSVAQHTLALLLALATRLPDYQQAVRSRWQQSSQFCLLDFPIVELEGKTLGLLGRGELGGAVARLAEAFGMRVLLGQLPDGRAGGPPAAWRTPATGRRPDPALPADRGHPRDARRRRTGADEAWRFLVNTARGGLVDEQALADALRGGHLGGAATDAQRRAAETAIRCWPRHPAPDRHPHSAWGSRGRGSASSGQLAETQRHGRPGAPCGVVNAG